MNLLSSCYLLGGLLIPGNKVESVNVQDLLS